MTLEIVPFYSIGQITILYNIGISYITLHFLFSWYIKVLTKIPWYYGCTKHVLPFD